jgi:2-iminobutanoate/2-iminopropanoate deaminase
VIHTQKAPQPVGPYSQAIVVDGWLFSAGQVGLDPRTGKLVEGGVKEQARRTMQNLQAVLAEAGASFADVIKTNIFLTRMDDFATVNEVYATWFEAAPPARSTVAVTQLPVGAAVEIDVVARLG